jgi:thiol-disulfide isomerase/thioredoxin
MIFACTRRPIDAKGPLSLSFSIGAGRLFQGTKVVRRTALTMLAGWPVGLRASRAMAAPPAETRQLDALQRSGFIDAQGSAHHLAELTKPLVLVNLWAAWCPGCLSELPEIRTLAQRLGPDAMDVVMLSHSMNWEGDVAYARRAAIPFRHWRLAPMAADGVVADAFRIEDARFGLPQSLILAGRGRVLVGSSLGTQDWSSAEQIRRARAWLAAAN